MTGIEARIARVVGDVLRQALADADAGGIVLLDDGSPQTGLAARWIADALGPDRLATVGSEGSDRDTDEEARRHAARTEAAGRGWITAHPTNKTALLLSRRAPPEPLLPLGDLYARDVLRFAHAASLPDDVQPLVRLAGGVEPLDAALYRLIDRREPAATALRDLDAGLRTQLLQRLRLGRFWRRHAGLVPKLGARTVGVDLLP